jgi:hypothetical protein
METTRFDSISKRFAQRRLSRRQALQQGGAGLAAAGLTAAGLHGAVAQDATPVATPTMGNPTSGAVSKTEYLFLQSFESGSIAPKEGAEGTYTLTLQHGLGQTIYFADRPERTVGAAPTAKFLHGLGFPADNPPNAALVVDTGDGDVDIAVVELTNPRYDEESFTAVYDVTVLKDYETEVDLQFQEAPADLAALAPAFGSAHLFIDDCPDSQACCGRTIHSSNGGVFNEIYGIATIGQCWTLLGGCNPCGDLDGISQYCDNAYPAQCQGHCWGDWPYLNQCQS